MVGNTPRVCGCSVEQIRKALGGHTHEWLTASASGALCVSIDALAEVVHGIVVDALITETVALSDDLTEHGRQLRATESGQEWTIGVFDAAYRVARRAGELREAGDQQ